MTDADLIAALGWEPCREDATSDPAWRCAEHEAILNSAGVCDTQRYRLQGARAGIDLAREGIAEAVQDHMWVPVPHGAEAARIAREWQP